MKRNWKKKIYSKIKKKVNWKRVMKAFVKVCYSLNAIKLN